MPSCWYRNVSLLHRPKQLHVQCGVKGRRRKAVEWVSSHPCPCRWCTASRATTISTSHPHTRHAEGVCRWCIECCCNQLRSWEWWWESRSGYTRIGGMDDECIQFTSMIKLQSTNTTRVEGNNRVEICREEWTGYSTHSCSNRYSWRSECTLRWGGRGGRGGMDGVYTNTPASPRDEKWSAELCYHSMHMSSQSIAHPSHIHSLLMYDSQREKRRCSVWWWEWYLQDG